MQRNVDLIILVKKHSNSGADIFGQNLLKRYQLLPLSLVILMHPTTPYSYSSVRLPGLEKFAPTSAREMS